MKDTYRILHLEDVPTDAELVRSALKESNFSFEIQVIDCEKEYRTALNGFLPDIILSDHSLPGFNSFEALRILRKQKNAIPFIVITATMTEELAVSIVTEGAADYIMKDRLKRLPYAVINAIEKFRFDKERQQLIDKVYESEALSNALIKESSAKLRQALNVFENIMDSSLDIICSTDEQGKFVTVSAAAEQTWGYKPSELTGRKCIDFVFSDDVERTNQSSKNIINGTPVTIFENRHLHKNGKIVPMLWSAKWDEKDKLTYCIAKDASEKKLAEQELKSLSGRLLLATSSAGMGIWDWDIKKDQLLWDEGMYRLYQMDSPNVVSIYTEWLSRLHPDDRNRVNDEIQMAITGEKKYNTEFRIVFQDGSVHYVRATGITESNDVGSAIRMTGVNWDTTERKLAEINLKKLNEDLQKHAKELALSNAELEQFAYVASHDLQEPLRMITSFLAQLENKYGNIIDDKGKKYIGFAVDGARRMRQVILDLLEFSRIGRMEDDEKEVDLNELLDEIRILLRKKIEDKNATLTIDNLPNIHAHSAPMRQVFQNLIGNALKYCKKDIPAKIHITAKEFNDHWQFAVADNGIGIEEEYFEKIFVIFQRLHNREEYAGTGMGLAIAKKIIETAGGKIWVQSTEGTGSIFNFTVKK